MKTIEVAGSPFNVDEATASSILNARQARQSNQVAQEAKHMAEAAMEQAARIEVMGDRPLYLDSLELANELHQDGLLDVLYVGDEAVFVTPSFAQELRADGLIEEIHTDAKCQGRGWGVSRQLQERKDERLEEVPSSSDDESKSIGKALSLLSATGKDGPPNRKKRRKRKKR